MNTHEIRKKYLEFFASKGHKVLPSASLLPENDPTTLFTGSGMQPMVPYLLGQPHPEGTRIADSQKCFRSQDIEEVGDNRHTTFFEMLGNWSLGDYTKHQQIPWMFEFLTEVLGLNERKLYITCFRGMPYYNIPPDEDSASIWKNMFHARGIEADFQYDAAERGIKDKRRIFFYDETKNWWSRAGVPSNMPEGEPGGPDSEMFWDFGAELKLHEASEYKDKPCHVNCDCGRFMEIGNNVFMEYVKTEEGFAPLRQKNVDFGGGLERIAAAYNNNPDVFMIDLFADMRAHLEKVSGKIYGADPKNTRAFRVILDHLRAAVFLMNDGALPSNKDQGYFTRRLIRRAVRFGNELGIQDNFCEAVAEEVVSTYQDVYPALLKNKIVVLAELIKEETKFRKTLEQGLKQFQILTKNNKPLTSEDAFLLYQSFGFPKEVMRDLSKEHNLTFDENGFEEERKKHQDMSRAGSEQKFKGGLADTSEMSVKYHTATHLLHATLRKVLGEHVEQKGSNITPERLRFDFSHPAKMTDEQKKQVEDMINAVIANDLPVNFKIMPASEAKALGAMGLFEDKYAQMGDNIKVYSIGDDARGYYSREICGGPHVEHTSTLGHFKIIKEEAVSAGVRRIKAVLE